ncbi:hypothetical protein, partial [Leptospira kanakyensis]|uniref:hypothetical protein n=1 Tax=Leptospira kanakyensis TaxID=2484968 RepID=UPI00223D9214
RHTKKIGKTMSTNNKTNKIDLIYWIAKILSNKKLVTLFGVVSIILGIISFFSETYYKYILKYLSLHHEEYPDIRITFILFGLSAFAILYLQSGEKDKSFTVHLAKDLFNRVNSNKEDTIQLNSKLEHLSKKIKDVENEKLITQSDKENIIQEIYQNLNNSTIDKIIENRLQEITDLKQNQAINSEISNFLNKPENRILKEIKKLDLRANLNLVIGMAITCIGMALLYNTVNQLTAVESLKEYSLKGTEPDSAFYKNIILSFAPRLSLVIFIEVFAYFFLKLYKSGLEEIKYYQNELTNIQLKNVSAVITISTNLNDGLKTVLDSYSATERNFILNKNQTTVELEKAKTDTYIVNNFIKLMSKFIKEK